MKDAVIRRAPHWVWWLDTLGISNRCSCLPHQTDPPPWKYFGIKRAKCWTWGTCMKLFHLLVMNLQGLAHAQRHCENPLPVDLSNLKAALGFAVSHCLNARKFHFSFLSTVCFWSTSFLYLCIIVTIKKIWTRFAKLTSPFDIFIKNDIHLRQWRSKVVEKNVVTLSTVTVRYVLMSHCRQQTPVVLTKGSTSTEVTP